MKYKWLGNKELFVLLESDIDKIQKKKIANELRKRGVWG